MIIEQRNTHLLISDDSFLWRYMDFVKTYSFLKDRKMYFARLDTFDDPLEGLSINIRQRLNNISLAKSDLINPNLHQETINEIRNTKVFFDEILNCQLACYCSCWLLTENTNIHKHNHDESLSMWNLYSCPNGFVIKIKFDNLLKAISNFLKDFSDKEITKACYGKVEYLNTYDRMMKMHEKLDSLRYINKDKEFTHEKEIRFLLIRDKELSNRKSIEISLYQELFQNIEVIASPNMPDLNFKLYKELFESIGVTLNSSEVITKDRLMNMISYR
jgi:hypothetical protein